MENKVKHLYVTIYRYPNADCSNNGLSSKHDMLVCFDGDVEDVKHYVEENGYDIHECLYAVRRMLWGEPHPYLTPLEWAIKTPNGNVSLEVTMRLAIVVGTIGLGIISQFQSTIGTILGRITKC